MSSSPVRNVGNELALRAAATRPSPLHRLNRPCSNAYGAYRPWRHLITLPLRSAVCHDAATQQSSAPSNVCLTALASDGTRVKLRNIPPSTIHLSASTDEDAYATFNLSPPRPALVYHETAVVAQSMGLGKQDLLRVDKRITTTNKEEITIIAAVLLALEGSTAAGEKMCTSASIYVSSSTYHFYLRCTTLTI